MLCGFYLFPSGLFFLAVKTDTHTQTYAHNKKDAINKSLNCRCNCYLKVPLPNGRCRCCTPFRIFAPCHRSPLFVPSVPDTGSSNRDEPLSGAAGCLVPWSVFCHPCISCTYADAQFPLRFFFLLFPCLLPGPLLVLGWSRPCTTCCTLCNAFLMLHDPLLPVHFDPAGVSGRDVGQI